MKRQPGKGHVPAVTLLGLNGVSDWTMVQARSQCECWQNGGQSHTCDSSPLSYPLQEEEKVISF